MLWTLIGSGFAHQLLLPYQDLLERSGPSKVMNCWHELLAREEFPSSCRRHAGHQPEGNYWPPQVRTRLAAALPATPNLPAGTLVHVRASSPITEPLIASCRHLHLFDPDHCTKDGLLVGLKRKPVSRLLAGWVATVSRHFRHGHAATAGLCPRKRTPSAII